MDAISNQATLEDAGRVARRCGVTPSQIYKLCASGRFPEPIIRQPRFTRWRSTDVDTFIANPNAWLSKKEGA